MLIIKFTLFNEAVLREVRFAQNRSETFDRSFTVWKEADAKTFQTVKDAHRWLARHGFMRRSTRPFYSTGYTSAGLTLPGLFDGWEVIQAGTCDSLPV